MKTFERSKICLDDNNSRLTQSCATVHYCSTKLGCSHRYCMSSLCSSCIAGFVGLWSKGRSDRRWPSTANSLYSSSYCLCQGEHVVSLLCRTICLQIISPSSTASVHHLCSGVGHDVWTIGAVSTETTNKEIDALIGRRSQLGNTYLEEKLAFKNI